MTIVGSFQEKRRLKMVKIFKSGGICSNKTGTSKVGAISKAQKAQSFPNMLSMYS